MPPLDRTTISVLLADSDDVARAGIGALLDSDARFLLTAATDTGEAAATARSRRPDVVVLDPRESNGLDLSPVRLLHDAVPEAALLVFTATFDPDWLRVAMAAGVRGYLLKGVTPSSLLRETVALVGRHQAMVVHPGVAHRLATVPAPAARPVEAPAAPLSGREREVLLLLAEGLSDKAIAVRLGISRPTVASHVRRLQVKLGAQGRVQLGIRTARHGLDEPALLVTPLSRVSA